MTYKPENSSNPSSSMNEQNQHAWSIELCETLAHWGYLHHVTFGRPVFHTFLRLKNAADDVVQEIHGGAALLNNQQAERISTKNFLKASLRSLLLNGNLPDFALLARVHDGYFRNVLHVHKLIVVPQQQALESWGTVLDATAAFNRAGHIYDVEKLNCNSLTHALALKVENKLPERLTFAPGFEHPIAIDTLLKDEFAPSARGKDLHELQAHVNNLTALANAPFTPQALPSPLQPAA